MFVTAAEAEDHCLGSAPSLPAVCGSRVLVSAPRRNELCRSSRAFTNHESRITNHQSPITNHDSRFALALYWMETGTPLFTFFARRTTSQFVSRTQPWLTEPPMVSG